MSEKTQIHVKDRDVHEISKNSSFSGSEKVIDLDRPTCLPETLFAGPSFTRETRQDIHNLDTVQSTSTVLSLDATQTKVTNDITVPSDGISQTSRWIFDQSITPPATKYALPEIGERITSTPQLAYCLGLLRLSSLSNDGLDEAELTWSQARSNDPDENKRLYTIATGVVKEFIRDDLKKPNVVSEVVSLAAVLDKQDFRKLLQTFIDIINHSVLLEIHLLNGLAQLIQNAGQGYINADDLVKILGILSTRLKNTHKQSTEHVYPLAITVSDVLDSMVDSQVEGLSRDQLHEPLSQYLKDLQDSSDPYLAYQAAYGYQAIQYIPDDETILQSMIRRTGKVVQGVSGIVSAVKALDLDGFIQGLQGIQESLSGAEEAIVLIKDAYGSAKALVESGMGFVESLQSSFNFTHRSAWYPAIRGLDRLIQEGRFREFEKLIREAPCKLDPAFQWGVCQRLGEISINPVWDAKVRKCAVVFLMELYKDDTTWGQQPDTKQLILIILDQLRNCESIVADDTLILLQELVSNGSSEKRSLYQDSKKNLSGPYPITTTISPSQESSLLICVQNKPDVETPLLRLKRNRLKNKGVDVYMSPRAKAGARAKADFDLTSKVQDFLDSNKKVFLILGDSGSGKSTFDRALEVSLWEKYGKENERIPLFISLPAIDKPEYDMITKQLQRHDFTEDQIIELKTHREFVVICDGYDESQQTRNLYTSNMLNQPGGWRGQMVISCRTEYNGVHYRDCFEPINSNSGRRIDLFQEAIIAPFNKSQIQDYIKQYVAITNSPWKLENYLQALEQVPNLQDMMKNPFLLKLALEVLPRVLNADSKFSAARITRVILYDEFIAQWIERGKIRLMEMDLSLHSKESFKMLSATGFKQNSISYLKELATAIYDNQNGVPVVSYSELRDQNSWKEPLFNTEDGKDLLREAIPLTRDGDHYQFIHRSVLEYGLSLAVIDPSDDNSSSNNNSDKITTSKSVESRRGSASSDSNLDIPVLGSMTTNESLLVSPLGRRYLVDEKSILQFLAERVQQRPKFKDHILAVIENSKTDKTARIGAANAITILVRAGVQFGGADLRGIKIPKADLSFGVFDSVQLEGADLRKANLRNIWLRQANLDGTQMKGVQFGELPFIQEESVILCSAISPDGKTYAVGTEKGYINLYSTSTWIKIHSLKGHVKKVNCLVFSLTGEHIASGSDDETVRLWDIDTGNCIHTMQGHNEIVTSVVYSPEGDQIASGGEDNKVRLWDISTGNCLLTLHGHSHRVTSVVYSPKGGQIASGSRDITVRLWDVNSRNCIHTFQGHTKKVTKVVYSPDGDLIASGSDDKSIRLWDVSTGDCVHTMGGHSDSVDIVVYSPKGDQIASGSYDKTVRLWDVSTGNCIYTLQGHRLSVTSIVYSPKGDQIASGSNDKTVRLWDVDSGDCVFTLQGNGAVTSVVYSLKGDQILSGSHDMTVRLWDVDNGEHIQTSQGHSKQVTSVVYSKSGVQIASGSHDETIRLWDIETGDCIYVLQGHSNWVTSIVYSPKGDRIVSGSFDKTVRLWDVESGDCIYTLSGHKGAIISVAHSPREDQIASGSWDMTVRLWDVNTGDCIHILQGHSNWVSGVAYSPKGDQIASGSHDKTVWLWDVSTGSCTNTLYGHNAAITSVVYSPKGDQIASGSADKTVRLWDVNSGDSVHILQGHDKTVTSVVYSPRGDQIASGSDDKTVMLWNVDNGQHLITLSGFDGSVNSIDWANTLNGQELMTGSEDKSVRRWRISKDGEDIKVILAWSSFHGVLTVLDASFGAVQELADVNSKLLSQRGALNI
ncbi:hypothetical protein BGZ49_008744 [Haplosporangium sp. Z 27]|nr:hypothetical protein BGZ49_008744 [Haplosporangium sp. Z 27]